MYELKVQISDLVFQFITDYEVKMADPFIPFLSENREDYQIKVCKTTFLSEPKYPASFKGEFFNSYLNKKEMRYFHPDSQHRDETYLRTTYNYEQKRIEIEYLSSGMKYIDAISNLFFHIGLEEIMMHEKRMILHSCFMKTDLGGLLFSGPSGIGKSTQGELWKKYEHSTMINGDRPIIYKKGDTWVACGSPYAGSSRCHVQDETGIRAIIMLKQAPFCRITRLRKGEAYRKIYAMLTVCDWNPDFMNQVLEQLELLVNEIPVYQLECTPDQKAVNLLKETLLSEDTCI